MLCSPATRPGQIRIELPDPAGAASVIPCRNPQKRRVNPESVERV